MESGIVIINKEIGMTSQNVVSKVKKILNIKKAGHIGTLDPLATGVLPVLIGNATKLSKYLIEHNKKYRAKLKLGEKTDTADSEGKVIENKVVPDLIEDDIINVFKKLEGKQKQAPHKYSAVKINGKKLYEYARNNEEVEIPQRDIEIYYLKLLDYDKEKNELTFETECSKGTYIRVLCETIAEKLGTIGYMKGLKRISVDKFTIDNAVNLDDLTENDIISVEELCKNTYKKLELNDRKLELFLNGVMLTFNQPVGVYMIYNNQKFIGLGTINNELLKRDVVM